MLVLLVITLVQYPFFDDALATESEPGKWSEFCPAIDVEQR